MDQTDIIDGLKVICICKAIRKKTVLDLIKDGCRTVEEFQEATGAGSGPCQGQRCTPKIIEIFENQRG
ncbi:MAG: (2Fe-2S)-binding protein [Proteobacteria bacterium]|nr:(2Fe-2S)-binding protein [Pseudomonadota bacterium]MBU1686802.1 (2Fe-2S)-binding protein [Pseudomonadota bacterium]